MHPDPEVARRISALLDDVTRPDGSVTTPDGRVYTKRSAPAPGVRTTLDATLPGAAPQRVLTIFEPVPERPAGYPAELPFVPGAAAIVNHALKTIPPAIMVLWAELSDAAAVDSALLELSVADGWVVTAEPAAFAPGLAAPRELRRGTERRLLSRVPAEHGGGSSVMLMQS